MTSLLEKVAEYIELTQELQRDMHSRLVVSEQQAEELQKQASASRIDSTQVEQAVDRMIAADLLATSEKEACVQQILDTPEILFSFIDKLAELSRKPAEEPPAVLPPLGRGRRRDDLQAKEASSSASDQAWDSGLERLRGMLPRS